MTMTMLTPSSHQIRPFSLALTICFGLVSDPVLAQVRVDVPPECGSQRQFDSELGQLPGLDPQQLPATHILISPTPDGAYQLRITQPQGVRQFTDPECPTLFRTAVVVTAASLPSPAPSANDTPPSQTPDPARPETAPSPTQAAGAALPPPEPTKTQAPEATLPRAVLNPQPPVAPSAAHVPASGLGARLGLGLGASLGLSTSLAAGVELSGALDLARWGASLTGRYLPPTEDLTHGELGVRMQGVGLRAAAHHQFAAWVRLDVGVSAYRFAATGLGVRYPASDTVWLAAPEAEVSLSPLQIGAFSAEIAVRGHVALNQPSFKVEPDTEVYQLPRIGAGALFRISWSSQ